MREHKGIFPAPRLLFAVALLLVSSLLMLASCGESDPQESNIVEQLRKNAEEFEYAIGKPGGTLTFATISEPLSLNLAISNDASSSSVLGNLFEGLTETSWLTDEVEPALAESWQRSDDGLTWTFNIRKDVRWHDGQLFTAHDVDFTFNRIIYNNDIAASSRPTFHFRYFDEATGRWEESPMTVTALDDYTVQCVLPLPFAPFLRSMGTAIYPKHILEKHVDDGTFESTWDIETDPSEIIGTGPFTIESYEPGQSLVLKRNPDYWLKDSAGNSLPYLDKIVRVIVPDLAAELAKFRAGESDTHGVTGEEFADLELLQESENFTLYRRGPAFGTTFLAFNMNPGVNAETGQPYLTPEKLELVQHQGIPPGHRPQHRQGHCNQGRTPRPRLPPMGLHKPRHRGLPQPLRPALRIQPGQSQRYAGRLGLDGYRRRRDSGRRQRQPHCLQNGDQHRQHSPRGRG